MHQTFRCCKQTKKDFIIYRFCLYLCTLYHIFVSPSLQFSTELCAVVVWSKVLFQKDKVWAALSL